MNPNNSDLSRSTCILVMLIALALGCSAVYVSREYAHANLLLLSLDGAALAVRQSAIDLLLLADIALFFVAALVPRDRFRSLRYKLLVLGLLIWAFDCAHTYQARFGIVMAGQSTAAASTQRATDLRASIESLRATAGALRQSAARQAGSLIAASRADGSASLRRAIDADQRAETLSAELAGIEHSRAPAEADVWGQWTPYKSFAESVLISLIGLIMFGMAGEMLRAARDAGAKPTGAARPEPKPAPLPQWTAAMPKVSTAATVAAVPLGAMAAPMATYAPPLPTPPSISVPAVLQAPATVLAQAQPQAQQAVPTEESTAAERYARVKAAVLAGRIKPSVRSVQAEAASGTLLARRYLQLLAAEGVLVRAGQGWALAVSPDRSQLTLAGL